MKAGGAEAIPPSPPSRISLVSEGFAPVVLPGVHVLILGSLPGAASLLLGQYYGNAQNRFWWIMGELFGAGPALPYAQRLDALRRAGIALWDVCAAAERPGSLDSSIRPHSVVANDIGALLAGHPHIELICFNGGGAARLFNRFVRPGLGAAHGAVPCLTLPSTSPAHAARSAGEKLAIWRAALAPAGKAGEALQGRMVR